MSGIETIPNGDLVVTADNQSAWAQTDRRRYGWHNLHRIVRYCTSFRAASVMTLAKCMDLRIANLDSVRHLTSLPWFSAMVVLRGQQVVFERYAPDFGPDRPHSIQSITKTTMHLVAGQLVQSGVLDLLRTVSHYVPEIGSGYASATIQQLLNMDVVNDYTEDFADPASTYFLHEEAMGWRLPREARGESTQREFLASITGGDTTNHTGQTQYKCANTDLLGWIVERASNRPLRAYLADITDAAGIEGAFYISTDREGFPSMAGGGCLSARDLARYFSLFVRGGCGVNGRQVGSPEFLQRSLTSGVARPPPYEGMRYSNHLVVFDRTVGHGGWGGQYAMANLDTGTVGIFFSVLENQHATTRDYVGLVTGMLRSVTAM